MSYRITQDCERGGFCKRQGYSSTYTTLDSFPMTRDGCMSSTTINTNLTQAQLQKYLDSGDPRQGRPSAAEQSPGYIANLTRQYLSESTGREAADPRRGRPSAAEQSPGYLAELTRQYLSEPTGREAADPRRGRPSAAEQSPGYIANLTRQYLSESTGREADDPRRGRPSAAEQSPGYIAELTRQYLSEWNEITVDETSVNAAAQRPRASSDTGSQNLGVQGPADEHDVEAATSLPHPSDANGKAATGWPRNADALDDFMKKRERANAMVHLAANPFYHRLLRHVQLECSRCLKCSSSLESSTFLLECTCAFNCRGRKAVR